MMGKTHLVVSTGVTLSALQVAEQEISAPIIAVTLVSALLPDIDEPNSLLAQRTLPNKLIKWIKTILIFSGIALLLFGESITPLHYILGAALIIGAFMPNRTMRKVLMVGIGILLILYGESIAPWDYIAGALLVIIPFLPHRGLTHSLYGIAVWVGILYYASYTAHDHVIWIAGGLSYLIHLLCDALTNTGIRLLPPFDWRLKIPIMSTGSFKGKIVEFGFVLMTLFLVIHVFLLDLK